MRTNHICSTDADVNTLIRNLFLNVLLVLGILVTFLVTSNVVSAATIHGDIYSVTLDQELNARIEINTMPKQVLISKDGSYKFSVPTGNYTITTVSRDGFSKESISVVDSEGDYVIDIVLEPTLYNPGATFSEIENITNDSDIGQYITDEQTTQNYPWTLIIILAAVFLSIVYFVWKIRGKWNAKKQKSEKQQTGIKTHADQSRIRKKTIRVLRNDKKQEKKRIEEPDAFSDEYSMNVLSIIKKEKRMTQKELRKQIPLSEGKVSLMLTHLEDDGKIRKIKKGRGNIIIFVKD